MCQFWQTPDGRQLLAAHMPGALPAYQLPVMGKLPSAPLGRWANCQLLTWQLWRKTPTSIFQAKFDVSGFLSYFWNSVSDECEQFSAEQEVQKPCDSWVVASSMLTCSSAKTGANCQKQELIATFSHSLHVYGELALATTPANPNIFWTVLRRGKNWWLQIWFHSSFNVHFFSRFP